MVAWPLECLLSDFSLNLFSRQSGRNVGCALSTAKTQRIRARLDRRLRFCDGESRAATETRRGLRWQPPRFTSAPGTRVSEALPAQRRPVKIVGSIREWQLAQFQKQTRRVSGGNAPAPCQRPQTYPLFRLSRRSHAVNLALPVNLLLIPTPKLAGRLSQTLDGDGHHRTPTLSHLSLTR